MTQTPQTRSNPSPLQVQYRKNVTRIATPKRVKTRTYPPRKLPIVGSSKR